MCGGRDVGREGVWGEGMVNMYEGALVGGWYMG